MDSATSLGLALNMLVFGLKGPQSGKTHFPVDANQGQ